MCGVQYVTERTGQEKDHMRLSADSTSLTVVLSRDISLIFFLPQRATVVCLYSRCCTTVLSEDMLRLDLSYAGL